jgi:large-conductance mechanosensitive channel
MSVVNFILVIIALIIAVLAYQRAGGTKELRDKTANALKKMEQTLRRIEDKDEKGEHSDDRV